MNSTVQSQSILNRGKRLPYERLDPVDGGYSVRGAVGGLLCPAKKLSATPPSCGDVKFELLREDMNAGTFPKSVSHDD
jgi:hypothetical protein